MSRTVRLNIPVNYRSSLFALAPILSLGLCDYDAPLSKTLLVFNRSIVSFSDMDITCHTPSPNAQKDQASDYSVMEDQVLFWSPMTEVVMVISWC